MPDGRTLTLPASEVFYLRQYNPDDSVFGLSPLETLRKLLAAEEAAVTYREWFWQNGAKLAGWIKRPKEAPRWTEQQRKQFGEEWRGFQGPSNAGKTAILEDGMEFTPITATARESELIEARKLTREEVAAAYHVPPAMLGILEAQGYGSLREQHKALYQDTLGPVVAMLEGEIERQLLVEFSDSEDVYVQFNINEKLQGSFEEEQAALAAAVGSPYMTRNEARARLNLPRINDAAFDVPVTRLDIAEGQNARDAATAKPPAAPVSAVVVMPALAPPPPPPLDLAPLGDRIVRAVRALPGELVHALPAPPSPPEPVDLTPLGDRIERALQALQGTLPADIAARMPVPAPPTAVTRTVRDEAGRIVALEDRAADGTVLRRRVVIPDADGRPREVEVADVGREA
jgi:hypothetical protein